MSEIMIEKCIRNPKRYFANNRGKSAWYDYYAGYSSLFVTDVLNYLKLSNGSVVMDPWNGSGTTTHVVQESGYSAVGFDINPVMVIVAKSRSLNCEASGNLMSLCNEIIDNSQVADMGFCDSPDPLELWFSTESARAIRNIECVIHRLLVDSNHYQPLCKRYLGSVSSLASFFYVALFRTVKDFLHSFRTTNPTWIKSARTRNEKVSIEASAVFEHFKGHILSMSAALGRSSRTGSSGSSVIRMASSDDLPIFDNSVDAVVSSPPYCTRIDYVVATLPELAVLGLSEEGDLRQLRNKMIGTPTICRDVYEIPVSQEWGGTCIHFLANVKLHKSKASSSYYYRNLIQYFSSLHRSFIEIDRTLRESGQCILVVQDSYYKDIHLDLAMIVTEMGSLLSWQLLERLDFSKNQLYGRRKTYNLGNRVVPTESVLFFRKARGS